jgi:hypothetical protein
VPSVVEAASGLGSKIGRHFSISGLLPSLFLTLWVYLPLASGAPEHHPDLSRLGHAFTSLTGFAWLLAVALVVGLLLHPLQLPVTQFLEGYWGSGKMGVAAAAVRSAHHRDRRRRLNSRVSRAEAVLRQAPQDMATRRNLLSDKVHGDVLLPYYIRSQEAQRERNHYPDLHRTMPTMLGNVLRRYEDMAGRSYGLDTIQVAPYLASAATGAPLDYLTDAREEMDTAISLSVAALLATAITAALLLLEQGWLLLALVPHVVAYVSYRGAVSAASEYGTALSVVLSLSRFELYQSLHLPLPHTLAEEQSGNEVLALLLGGEASGRVADEIRYRHPDAQQTPAAGE